MRAAWGKAVFYRGESLGDGKGEMEKRMPTFTESALCVRRPTGSSRRPGTEPSLCSV